MRRLVFFGLVLPFILLAAGCAKSPENAAAITGKRLLITMSVAGEINPNYHYFVAFDTSGTPTPGPLPVVGSPWGNGWGTGNISNYIQFDALQPQGGYSVFRIEPNTNLLGSVYIGPPISVITPQVGSNKLQFTLDLSQLATPTMPVDQIQTININFITTDIIPVDPNYPGPKFYDALGPTGNEFITISAQINQRYSNTQTGIEEPGDVRSDNSRVVNVPDLDIIDWSVEVQGL